MKTTFPGWTRQLFTAAESVVAREFFTLVLVLLVTGGIWGFIELADEVIEGEAHAIDTAILLALRNPADPADPLGPKWLEELFRDFTALGGVGVLVFISLGVAGHLVLQRKRRALLLLFIAVAGGMILSSVLKGVVSPNPRKFRHLKSGSASITRGLV